MNPSGLVALADQTDQVVQSHQLVQEILVVLLVLKVQDLQRFQVVHLVLKDQMDQVVLEVLVAPLTQVGQTVQFHLKHLPLLFVYATTTQKNLLLSLSSSLY